MALSGVRNSWRICVRIFWPWLAAVGCAPGPSSGSFMMARSLLQQRRNLFQQAEQVYRLDVIIITAGIEGFLAVAGQGVRRQRNDGNGSGLWRTFELARRFPAVEHRQIQIHQNQVGTLGARHLDSLCAVDG